MFPSTQWWQGIGKEAYLLERVEINTSFLGDSLVIPIKINIHILLPSDFTYRNLFTCRVFSHKQKIG